MTNSRVTLAPGSGEARKNWPLEHYAGLARLLEEQYEAEIWWILGPAEAGWQTELQKEFSAQKLRLLQDLPLGQLAAALAEFQLYVGNDSGVTHLAVALGRPAVVAILGPLTQSFGHPQGNGRVSWRRSSHAHPARQAGRLTAPRLSVCKP